MPNKNNKNWFRQKIEQNPIMFMVVSFSIIAITIIGTNIIFDQNFGYYQAALTLYSEINSEKIINSPAYFDAKLTEQLNTQYILLNWSNEQESNDNFDHYSLSYKKPFENYWHKEESFKEYDLISLGLIENCIDKNVNADSSLNVDCLSTNYYLLPLSKQDLKQSNADWIFHIYVIGKDGQMTKHQESRLYIDNKNT